MTNLWAIPFILVGVTMIGAGLIASHLDHRDRRRARRLSKRPHLYVIHGEARAIPDAERSQEGSRGQ